MLCENNSKMHRRPGAVHMPPEKSMLKGKVIQSQSREIVANVFAFMKREAELGPQIPFRCVTKRVIAATGVSERTIRRIQREAEIVFSGQAESFISPRQKKKKQKKSSGSGNEEENPPVKTENVEPDSPKRSKMLYPSLEDMKVDEMTKAQQRYGSPETFLQHHLEPRSVTSNSQCLYPSLSPSLYPAIEHASEEMQSVSEASISYPVLPSAPPEIATNPKSNMTCLYPSLTDYMGLELSEEIISQNMPDYRLAIPGSMDMVVSTSSVVPSTTVGGMIAPLSGQSPGLQRAHVTNGIRELTVCKDANGKVGLRVQTVNNGVFACVVVRDSPAAMAGLRFGDQLLQVNGICVSGFSMEEVHKLFRESPINGISVVVRDRPFERTVTLHKNSTGHVGFHFKNGKIIGIVPDSSAARNGLLTDHQILEVNGQNMVGVMDKDITASIEEGGPSITVTIIPSFVFDHMVKKMSSSLMKNLMDHSVPNI